MNNKNTMTPTPTKQSECKHEESAIGQLMYSCQKCGKPRPAKWEHHQPPQSECVKCGKKTDGKMGNEPICFECYEGKSHQPPEPEKKGEAWRKAFQKAHDEPEWATELITRIEYATNHEKGALDEHILHNSVIGFVQALISTSRRELIEQACMKLKELYEPVPLVLPPENEAYMYSLAQFNRVAGKNQALSDALTLIEKLQ